MDTLELRTTISLSAEQIGINSKEHGWVVSHKKLRNKRNHLKAESLSDPSLHFYFQLGMDKNISKIITKPDCFKSMVDLINALKLLTHPYDLNDLEVSRIDFTCDFEMQYYDFMKSLEIKRKQIKTDYVNGGGTMTGNYYGKGQETILAYDKAKQANLPNDISRLEVKVVGKKLPVKKITELMDSELFLKRVKSNNPFRSAHLFDLEIDPLLQQKPNGKEFLTLYNSQGFQAAKQQLNRDRNFERNIGRLLTMKPFEKQPSDILNEGLNVFCEDQLW